MTLNFVLYMQAIRNLHSLHIALIRYDHDDTGQAASTVMDILISKKRSLEFIFSLLFIVFHFEGTFSITERQNISESKSAPPPFTDL